MPTTKLLEANMALTANLTNAVLAALKAGMTQEDVLAAVQKLAELIESGEE